jgi:hypothetical protein
MVTCVEIARLCEKGYGGERGIRHKMGLNLGAHIGFVVAGLWEWVNMI